MSKKEDDLKEVFLTDMTISYRRPLEKTFMQHHVHHVTVYVDKEGIYFLKLQDEDLI